jgi:hypothetical protein
MCFWGLNGKYPSNGQFSPQKFHNLNFTARWEHIFLHISPKGLGTNVSYTSNNTNYDREKNETFRGNCVEGLKFTRGSAKGKIHGSQNLQRHISMTNEPILTLKDANYAAPKI